MTHLYAKHDSFVCETWRYIAANITLNLSAIALVKRGATHVWHDSHVYCLLQCVLQRRQVTHLLNLSAVALVKRGATHVNVWPDASATHTATNNKHVTRCDSCVTWRIQCITHCTTHCTTHCNILCNTYRNKHCICEIRGCDMTLHGRKHHDQSLYHGSSQTRCATWLIHMRDMTYSHLKHDSFVCETWLMDMWHHAQSLCRGSSQTRYVPGLIRMWDMTHSHLRHDSFVCETRLNHIWVMSHSYVRHDSFICDITLNLSVMALVKRGVWRDLSMRETWLILLWDMTYSYVSRVSFICETWLIHMRHHTQSLCHGSSQTRRCVTWLIHTWGMTQSPAQEWKIRTLVGYEGVDFRKSTRSWPF